jgi:hypothetical protein
MKCLRNLILYGFSVIFKKRFVSFIALTVKAVESIVNSYDICAPKFLFDVRGVREFYSRRSL